RRRVGIAVLVAKHRRVGHHFQIWKLREAVYQSFGQSVGQEVELWIAVGVDERKHGKRFDSVSAPIDGEQRDHRRSDHQTRKKKALLSLADFGDQILGARSRMTRLGELLSAWGRGGGRVSNAGRRLTDRSRPLAARASRIGPAS